MMTLWPRINTLMLFLLVLMAGAIITMLATRAYGGPLDPPGPVASTDGVRQPGTPISSLPFPITTPGNYYVTRHLTGAVGQGGIQISTSNVTVDLGGFSLIGVPGSLDGISVTGGVRNIVIRNGAVRGWFNGINAVATFSRIDSVQSSSNSGNGIIIGGGSEISNCTASLNGMDGINGDFVVVRNCIVAENVQSGIQLLDSSLVEGNHVFGNQQPGILLNGVRNVVRDNHASFSPSVNNDIDVVGSSNVVKSNVYCTSVNLGTDNWFVDNIIPSFAC